jgi:hypothetical protein
MTIKDLNPLKLLSALIGCLNRLVRSRMPHKGHCVQIQIRYQHREPEIFDLHFDGEMPDGYLPDPGSERNGDTVIAWDMITKW